MSSVWLEEYQGVPSGVGGTIPAHSAKNFLTSQVLTLSGTSQQSTAFQAGTTHVVVHADAACYIEFGTDPTVTTEIHLASGVYRDFIVPQGLSYKLAYKT
jgi:hypothetical protein